MLGFEKAINQRSLGVALIDTSLHANLMIWGPNFLLLLPFFFPPAPALTPPIGSSISTSMVSLFRTTGSSTLLPAVIFPHFLQGAEYIVM